MDALLLASITKNYEGLDATGWTNDAISRSTKWYKLYNGGVILYFTGNKDYGLNGNYRATVDGATWGTFPQVTQTVYSQPNPAEISARNWIDAWNLAHPSTNVGAGGSTTIVTSTTSTSPAFNWYMVVGVIAVAIVLIIVFYPRRKTIFDRRRK